MPKRSRIKKMSKEAFARKRMRMMRELSMREAAKLIGVSPTLINHTENGRATITSAHIQKFVKALNFSKEDRKTFARGDQKLEELRDKCFAVLKMIEPSKLEFIHKMLVNL